MAPSRSILIFGDSITEGNALPPEERRRLWVSLAEARTRGQLRLINEGKGGRPTNSLSEFEAALARHPRIDALVLALGMNDSRDLSADGADRAARNLEAMIDHARAVYGTIPVLVVGPSNIRLDALGPTRSIGKERAARLRELNEASRRWRS